MTLSHKRGDTWAGIQITLTEVDEDGVLIGPVDLTDAIIVSQLKKNSGDELAVFDFSTTEGTITINDATGGVFSLNSTIIDILPKVYLFDIQIEYPDGTIQTPVDGTFEIIADVTRL